MTWSDVWDSLLYTGRWMLWNLLLALIPLALSVWLFRVSTHRSLLWWVGAIVFVMFLPNAPYTLTDLIHLVEELRSRNSLITSTLVVIPKYLLFVLIGVETYVLSLINLGYYLKQKHLSRWTLGVELTLHGLSAIGVYLGRFERFNSWNLVTHPEPILSSIVQSLLDRHALRFILIGFSGIALIYLILKYINLALLYYYALRHSSSHRK